MQPEWVARLGALGLVCGCESGGIGDPCTPEPEHSPTFAGFGETEVYVESRSFQCETRLCLVNHFRGRVSCPYGQTEAAIATLPPDHGERCRLPGTDGSDETEAVTVPVPAQLYFRTAAASPARTGQGHVGDAVYCSCRCANANGLVDDGARYCNCPSGFSCTKLIEDVGIGSSELAGSYCIRDGSEMASTAPGETCAGSNCGNDGNNP
jgi:hypothetical protein